MFSNSTICFIISILCIALILVQKKDPESKLKTGKESKPKTEKKSQSELEDSETIEYEDLAKKLISITVETIANELIALNEELSPDQRIEVAKLMLERVRTWYFVLNVGDTSQAKALRAAAKRNNMSLLKFSIRIAYFLAITPQPTPETRKWVQEYKETKGIDTEKVIESIDTEMFGFKKNDEGARDFIRSIYDAGQRVQN